MTAAVEPESNNAPVVLEGYKVLEANPEIVDALSNIGYSMEAAIADLVDNSIDAKADAVLIRFLRSDSRLLNLLVIDNGRGMTESVIDGAMTFGEKRRYGRDDLGMYGMGLKSASLSQAASVTVVSKSRGSRPVGRQWTATEAKAGWRCGVVARSSIETELSRGLPRKLRLHNQGTLIRWDEVRDFQRAEGRVDRYLSGLSKSLVAYLGLQLHRFLEDSDLEVHVDSFNIESGGLGVPVPVTPLNPFDYPRSGVRKYPKTFQISLPDIGRINAVAHIWPPRSKTQQYKLGGGKVSGRQGFYFYRNKRLIQAGGWNMLRGDDAEPHLSLARVSVDLTKESAKFFSVRFNKAGVDAPRSFVEAVRSSKAEDGTSFEDYFSAAVEAYRTKTEPKLRPVLPPGHGLRSEVQTAIAENLPVIPREETVEFVWEQLPSTEFFRVDRDHRRLIINKTYRRAVLGGKRASGADAPLIKALLFLLTQQAFQTQRVSALEEALLDAFSNVLSKAARLEARK